MVRLRRREAPADGRMTVVEHLTEFRERLVKSFLAFLAGSVVAYIFYTSLLEILTAPLDEGGRIGGVTVEGLNVGGIVTGFLVRLKVSIFFGLVFALPVILWQLWRFIVPGLRPRERKFGIWFVVASMGLFALGTAVAFLILPKAIGFLLGFARAPLKPLIFVDQYLSFVSFMVIAFGVSFEFPLLLAFLAAIGIVTSRRLAGWRRQAAFGAFVIGAVATPSQDPYSMTLMAVPLYLLYEASILVIRFGMRK
ncbi:MAG: twin-arginine translocase subunit TatC [Actinomycetota bacterium]